MTNKFLALADDIQENLTAICRPTVFPGTFPLGGGYTPFFAVNAPPGASMGGLYVEATSALVATGGTVTAVAGSDLLDLVTAGYNVADAPNADARCRTVTRLGVEEAERLLVAPGNTQVFKYPRATAAQITAANLSPTVTVGFIIPCAEPTNAVQVQFKLPVVATTWSVSVTSGTVAYTVYPIPSVSPATVAYMESPLPQYGANAVVPLEQYQPTNISPDIVDFVNSTAATFNSISAYDLNGAELVNMLTATAITNAQAGWPPVPTSTASTFVNTRGSRLSRLAVNLAVTATLGVLWIQVNDVPSAGPTEGHDTTPTTPAASKTGKSVPGTVGSVSSKGIPNPSMGGGPGRQGIFGRRVGAYS
jgi:hypothetical protein